MQNFISSLVGDMSQDGGLFLVAQIQEYVEACPATEETAVISGMLEEIKKKKRRELMDKIYKHKMNKVIHQHL